MKHNKKVACLKLYHSIFADLVKEYCDDDKEIIKLDNDEFYNFINAEWRERYYYYDDKITEVDADRDFFITEFFRENIEFKDGINLFAFGIFDKYEDFEDFAIISISVGENKILGGGFAGGLYLFLDYTRIQETDLNFVSKEDLVNFTGFREMFNNGFEEDYNNQNTKLFDVNTDMDNFLNNK